MNDREHIEKGVEILRSGGVVAFPTDTVYGIGVDPFQSNAVRKLYEIKGRPKDRPIPILGDISDVDRVAKNLPDLFFKLAERFWPGALTLIVEAKDLPIELTASGKTVGVRMPNHITSLRLLKQFGMPIATTSANLSDQPPAISADQVKTQLGDRIDFVIDGGEMTSRIASTVLDLTVSPPKILRHGRISEDELIASCTR